MLHGGFLRSRVLGLFFGGTLAGFLGFVPGVPRDAWVLPPTDFPSVWRSRYALFQAFCRSEWDLTVSLGLPPLPRVSLVHPFFLHACLYHRWLSGSSQGQAGFSRGLSCVFIYFK